MEYRVIVKTVSGVIKRNVSKAATELAREVNQLAQQGWEPLGGVAIGDAGTAPYLLQAMVRQR